MEIDKQDIFAKENEEDIHDSVSLMSALGEVKSALEKELEEARSIEKEYVKLEADVSEADTMCNVLQHINDPERAARYMETIRNQIDDCQRRRDLLNGIRELNKHTIEAIKKRFEFLKQCQANLDGRLADV